MSDHVSKEGTLTVSPDTLGVTVGLPFDPFWVSGEFEGSRLAASLSVGTRPTLRRDHRGRPFGRSKRIASVRARRFRRRGASSQRLESNPVWLIARITPVDGRSPRATLTADDVVFGLSLACRP